MWSIVTPIPVHEPSVPELRPGKPNFLGYGEGWQLSDYRGNKLVWHTGGWPGMVSRLTLVPDKQARRDRADEPGSRRARSTP